MENSFTLPTTNDRKKKRRNLQIATQNSSEITHETNRSSLSINKDQPFWKSFMNLFIKNQTLRLSQNSNDSNSLAQTSSASSLHLEDIKDNFALVIFLPDNIRSQDVNISVEIKASERKKNESKTLGLNLCKDSPYDTIFCGYINVPSNITFEHVSKMPFYFCNEGKYADKVQSFIRPADDKYPGDAKKFKTINSLNLRIKLRNFLIKRNCHRKIKPLQYVFINNPLHSPGNHDLFRKTADLIEGIINDTEVFDDKSRIIVKDILVDVINKIGGRDTTIQEITKKVNEEIDDHQKLILRCNSFTRRIGLSKIVEGNETSIHEEGPVVDTSEPKFFSSSEIDCNDEIFCLKTNNIIPQDTSTPFHQEVSNQDIYRQIAILDIAKNKLLSEVSNLSENSSNLSKFLEKSKIWGSSSENVEDKVSKIDNLMVSPNLKEDKNVIPSPHFIMNIKNDCRLKSLEDNTCPRLQDDNTAEEINTENKKPEAVVPLLKGKFQKMIDEDGKSQNKFIFNKDSQAQDKINKSNEARNKIFNFFNAKNEIQEQKRDFTYKKNEAHVKIKAISSDKNEVQDETQKTSDSSVKTHENEAQEKTQKSIPSLVETDEKIETSNKLTYEAQDEIKRTSINVENEARNETHKVADDTIKTINQENEFHDEIDIIINEDQDKTQETSNHVEEVEDKIIVNDEAQNKIKKIVYEEKKSQENVQVKATEQNIADENKAQNKIQNREKNEAQHKTETIIDEENKAQGKNNDEECGSRENFKKTSNAYIGNKKEAQDKVEKIIGDILMASNPVEFRKFLNSINPHKNPSSNAQGEEEKIELLDITKSNIINDEKNFKESNHLPGETLSNQDIEVVPRKSSDVLLPSEAMCGLNFDAQSASYFSSDSLCPEMTEAILEDFYDVKECSYFEKQDETFTLKDPYLQLLGLYLTDEDTRCTSNIFEEDNTGLKITELEDFSSHSLEGCKTISSKDEEIPWEEEVEITESTIKSLQGHATSNLQEEVPTLQALKEDFKITEILNACRITSGLQGEQLKTSESNPQEASATSSKIFEEKTKIIENILVSEYKKNGTSEQDIIVLTTGTSKVSNSLAMERRLEDFCFGTSSNFTNLQSSRCNKAGGQENKVPHMYLKKSRNLSNENASSKDFRVESYMDLFNTLQSSSKKDDNLENDVKEEKLLVSTNVKKIEDLERASDDDDIESVVMSIASSYCSKESLPKPNCENEGIEKLSPLTDSNNKNSSCSLKKGGEDRVKQAFDDILKASNSIKEIVIASKFGGSFQGFSKVEDDVRYILGALLEATEKKVLKDTQGSVLINFCLMKQPIIKDFQKTKRDTRLDQGRKKLRLKARKCLIEDLCKDFAGDELISGDNEANQVFMVQLSDEKENLQDEGSSCKCKPCKPKNVRGVISSSISSHEELIKTTNLETYSSPSSKYSGNLYNSTSSSEKENDVFPQSRKNLQKFLLETSEASNDSGYDADYESSDTIFPEFRHNFKSANELNEKSTIENIEKNVRINNLLRENQRSSLDEKLVERTPLVPESVEFVTSPDLESSVIDVKERHGGSDDVA